MTAMVPTNEGWQTESDPCKRCGCRRFKVIMDEATTVELECGHCQLVRDSGGTITQEPDDAA